jgi:hypothetical protein
MAIAGRISGGMAGLDVEIQPARVSAIMACQVHRADDAVGCR